MNLNLFALLATACLGTSAIAESKQLPKLAIDIQPVVENNLITVKTDSGRRPTYLIPELQEQLAHFIQRGGNPIAGVVLIEVKTGHIIAMTGGRSPRDWGADVHSTLHEKFPSASLFKSIVASAAIEIAGVDPKFPIGLVGGCSKVREKGIWMADSSPKADDMSLEQAYGKSCNGFFAKLAVNDVGLGAILQMAERFRWQQPVPSDFFIPTSPLLSPDPQKSSAQTVGKFAAGFGDVGSSVMHAAWRTLVVASNGQSKPLKLFIDSPEVAPNDKPERIIAEKTAETLKVIMESTIKGTARGAFRGYRFRDIRNEMGGKTGTLTGHHPEGITTWFEGIYPLSDPQVAVAAVTVIEDLWVFKAPQLAAEAIASWVELQHRKKDIAVNPKKNSHVN